MSDFIEQEVSVTSPPELSVDTPTVSDSPLGTEPTETNPVHGGKIYPSLSDPDVTAATIAALKPFTGE